MANNLLITCVLIGAVLGAIGINLINLVESILRVFMGIVIAFLLISILGRVIK